MLRPRRDWRPLRVFAFWTGLSFVVAALLASAVPFAFGDRSYVVRSGSMTPAIATGDVVVVAPISPHSARVGDIVTFDDPHGRLISHRVRWIQRTGSRVRFTTQGDANTSQEHWQVRSDGRIGRVVYRVPKLGLAIVRAQSTPGRVGLIVVPALLLAASLLRAIWRRGPDSEVAGDVAS